MHKFSLSTNNHWRCISTNRSSLLVFLKSLYDLREGQITERSLGISLNIMKIRYLRGFRSWYNLNCKVQSCHFKFKLGLKQNRKNHCYLRPSNQFLSHKTSVRTFCLPIIWSSNSICFFWVPTKFQFYQYLTSSFPHQFFPPKYSNANCK